MGTEQVSEREKHRNWIMNPFQWPRMVCPLVNRSGEFHAVGVVLGALPDGSITLYKSNMYETITDDTERVVFQDVDALLDAGWVVD